LCVKGLKTAALVVVALVIVSVGLAYIAGMQVQRTLLNPEFCGKLVDQVNLGSAIQGMLREQMREEITKGEDAEQLDIIFDSMAGAFPPEWIEQQAKMALHDFIPFITGESDAVTAAIDLQERKDHLEEELLGRLEEMPTEQLEDSPFSPGTLQRDVAEFVQEMELPEELYVADLTEGMSEEAGHTVNIVRTGTAMFRFVPYLLFAVLLVFCYFLAGMSGGMKWFGACTATAGLIFILGLVVFRAAFLPAAAQEIAHSEDMPLDPDAVLSSVDSVLVHMYAFPVYYALIGVLILVAGIVLGRQGV